MTVADNWKALQLNPQDPSVEAPALTPEAQICATCRAFLKHCNPERVEDAPYMLEVAERLAEQILGHYGSLRRAANALQPHCSPGERLPQPVFDTFLYASVREHETLTVILDEIHALCEGKGWRELSSMDMVLQEPWFRAIARPRLWDEAGVMKYSPAAFHNIHGASLRRDLSAMFAEGASGVQRLLDYYPQVDEQGRGIFDTFLVNQVYYSFMADDHPVRLVLADKLDPVEDARARIAQLFDGFLCIRNEPGGPFMRQMDSCLGYVDTLSPEQALSALDQLSDVLSEFVDAGGHDLRDAFEPAQCLANIIERAAHYGYSALKGLLPSFKFMRDEAELIETMFKSIEFGQTTANSGKVAMEAVLLATDDHYLVSLGVDERVLAGLAIAKKSDVIRQALLKSATGRDLLFGQDLGL